MIMDDDSELLQLIWFLQIQVVATWVLVVFLQYFAGIEFANGYAYTS